LPLGENKPTLWIGTSVNSKPDLYREGYYNLHIIVLSDINSFQYTRFNWIQTCNYNYNTIIDNHGLMFPGFYNIWDDSGSYQILDGHKEAGYFKDCPNAQVSFKAELTLLGKKGNNWEVIASFLWGYTRGNDQIKPDGLTINIFPSDIHRNCVKSAIEYEAPYFILQKAINK
jgi:hypothetical protein